MKRLRRRRLRIVREQLLRSILLDPDAVIEREALWLRYFELKAA